MMIKRVIAEEEPVILALVETKMNKGEVIEKPPGYEIERVDRDEDGGGVMMIFKRSLIKILVATAEYKLHQAEMLWMKLNNGETKLKIGVIYMPQESRTSLEKLKEIYQIIEDEIIDAQQKEDSILILGDLNCKVGEIIKNNSAEITKGGRLLLKLVKRYRLKIVNAEDCCEGLWTRVEGIQKSVLDYVIVFEKDTKLVNRMKIDTERDITPYFVERNE